jgi:hypothetical protein
MATATTTRDHEKIRRWIEERGGKPATVSATKGKEGAGILRIDFPSDGRDQGLEPVSWEEFFQKFDEAQLEFLHQNETSDGETSRFFKFVRTDEDE